MSIETLGHQSDTLVAEKVLEGAPRPPLLRLERVSKFFNGRRVLADVDFDVAAGEVHALVGENGAGKSTLLNILTGVIAADSGHVFWNGRQVRLRSPRDARDLGILFVHQEIALAPQLSVAENIFLGRHPARRGWVRWPELRQRAVRAFEDLGHLLDPDAPVGNLNLAEQQLVEVARALTFDARLIVLDEPTAALPESSAERLRQVIRRLRTRGISFILVSHHLKDVFAVADRITLLRDGRMAHSASAAGTNEKELVKSMSGPISRRPKRARSALSPHTAEVAALEIRGPVNLSVRRGEVVGLAGLPGAGRTRFLEWLFCGGPVEQPCQVRIGGRLAVVRNARDAVREGLGLIPDDRAAKGLIPGASIRMNMVLAGKRDRFFIDRDKEQRTTGELAARLRIHANSLEQPALSLSGGDQQKALLARWIYAGSHILVLDEPSRGVDLRSKAVIYELIQDLVGDGLAVLLASSDTDELLEVADRIVVMYKGRIAGELQPGETTKEQILDMASGGGI